MRLLNASLLSMFKKVWPQAGKRNPLIICKFNDPTTCWSRYVTEYNEKTGLCYGYVSGDYSERKYFWLKELESINWKFSKTWRIERDEFFKPCNYSALFGQQKSDSRFILGSYILNVVTVLILIIQTINYNQQ